MRVVLLSAVMLFVCAGILLAGGGKLEWEKDYEKGLTAAKEGGKPAFLYFTADW